MSKENEINALATTKRVFAALFEKLTELDVKADKPNMAGSRAERLPYYFDAKIDGTRVVIEINQQYPCDSFYGNGKVSVFIGDKGYGNNRRRFPERKNFEAWIEAVAEYVIETAQEKEEDDRRSKMQFAFEEAVQPRIDKLEKLASKLGFDTSEMEIYPHSEDGLNEQPKRITKVSVSGRFELIMNKGRNAEKFLREYAALVKKYGEEE